MGSGSEISGQHLGRQLAVVVRLIFRWTVVKFGDEEVDGLTSFGVGIIETCSVGKANAVMSKEEAKRIKAKDSIECSKCCTENRYPGMRRLKR